MSGDVALVDSNPAFLATRVLVSDTRAGIEADEVRSSAKATGVFLSMALLEVEDRYRSLSSRLRHLLSRRHAMFRKKFRHAPLTW